MKFSLESALSDIGIDSGTLDLIKGSRLVAGSYITTETKGLAELDAALAKLPEHIARKTLKKAVAEGCELIRLRAVSLAPYDDYGKEAKKRRGSKASSQRTQHLKDGILKYVKTQDFGQNGCRIRGLIGLEKNPKNLSVYYGRFIEYGFGHYPDGTPIPAHPFMRPAFDEMKYAAVEIVKARLATGIQEAAKELNK
jgi:HK97 gp10 family phage protein